MVVTAILLILASAVMPLAHLGLARALARAGDVSGSEAAYKEVLAIWDTADPGFAHAAQARQELATLLDSR